MECLTCGKGIDDGGYCQDCQIKIASFYFNEAKGLFRFNEYEKALSSCKVALGISPSFGDAKDLCLDLQTKLHDFKKYFSLGEELHTKGQHQEALNCFEEARKIMPFDEKVKSRMAMERLTMTAVEKKKSEKSTRVKQFDASELVGMETFLTNLKMSRNFQIALTALVLAAIVIFSHLYTKSQRLKRARTLFERIVAQEGSKEYSQEMLDRDYTQLSEEFGGTPYVKMVGEMYGEKLGSMPKDEGVLADFLRPVDFIPTKKEQEVRVSRQAEETALSQMEGRTKKLFSKGDILFTQNAYYEAIVAWDHALLEATPQEVKVIKARIQDAYQRIENREKQYRDWIVKAQRAEEGGDHVEALNAYLKALELKPDDKFAYKHMERLSDKYLHNPVGLVISKITAPFKRKSGGRDGTEKSLKAYARKATLYEQKGKFLSAAKIYKRMWKLTQDSQYQERSVLMNRLSQIREKLARDPQNFDLHTEEALLYYERKDYNKALEKINELLATGQDRSRNVLLLSWKADLLRITRKYAQAQEIYSQIFYQVPSVFMKEQLGYLYLDMGSYAESIILLENVLKAYPNRLKAILGLARIYFQKGDLMEAKEVLGEHVDQASYFVGTQRVMNPFSFEDIAQKGDYSQGEIEQLINVCIGIGNYAAAARISAHLSSLID